MKYRNEKYAPESHEEYKSCIIRTYKETEDYFPHYVIYKEFRGEYLRIYGDTYRENQCAKIWDGKEWIDCHNVEEIFVKEILNQML